MRPEVFRFAQGAVSSDRIAINLVYVVRTQIVDPRAAFESTQNYRDEICIRLQSVVKAVCSRKSRLEIQTDHQSFSNSAQKAASQVLRAHRLRMPDVRTAAGRFRRPRRGIGQQENGRCGALAWRRW